MTVQLTEYFIEILETLEQLYTVEEFYMRVCNLRDLILENDPTYLENYFVACFIQGLNPVIADYVRNCVPHTFNSAYETALHKELELTKARQFYDVPNLEETAEAIVSEEIFINADHYFEEPRFDNSATFTGADSSHMMPISGGLLHVPLDNATMFQNSLKKYLQTSRHVNAVEDLEECGTNVEVIWSSSFDKVDEHSCFADNGSGALTDILDKGGTIMSRLQKRVHCVSNYISVLCFTELILESGFIAWHIAWSSTSLYLVVVSVKWSVEETNDLYVVKLSKLVLVLQLLARAWTWQYLPFVGFLCEVVVVQCIILSTVHQFTKHQFKGSFCLHSSPVHQALTVSAFSASHHLSLLGVYMLYPGVLIISLKNNFYGYYGLGNDTCKSTTEIYCSFTEYLSCKASSKSYALFSLRFIGIEISALNPQVDDVDSLGSELFQLFPHFHHFNEYGEDTDVSLESPIQQTIQWIIVWHTTIHMDISYAIFSLQSDRSLGLLLGSRLSIPLILTPILQSVVHYGVCVFIFDPGGFLSSGVKLYQVRLHDSEQAYYSSSPHG